MSFRKKEFVLLIGLFFLSIGFLYLTSFRVDPHASMDAAYYHVMVDQLEQGKGFQEPVVWQHLNEYENLDHPMDYWMPFGILAYYGTRFLVGENAEVWLNIFLWSLLITLVFSDIKRITNRPIFALVGSLTLLFSGRNLFYILTTDNIALYGFFGYLFIRCLCHKSINLVVCGILAGLIALTRIEGIIFAFLGMLWILYRKKSVKPAFTYLVIILIVLSPWFVRNYQTSGKIWTSNTKALFLRQYAELFSEDFPGTLNYFLQLGFAEIIKQKTHGLWDSLLNFIAVPGLFLFYPLWIFGLIKLWHKEGKLFFCLVGIFWLLCGLLFTHQSIRGTSLHISAFFFPHFSILNGVGLWFLIEKKKYNKAICIFMGAVVILWSLACSLISVSSLTERYNDDNQPYEKLFARKKFPENSKIVSAYPVYVYYLAGARGVVTSVLTASGPAALADKFDCGYILMDGRTEAKVLPQSPQWQQVATESYLSLFERKNP